MTLTNDRKQKQTNIHRRKREGSKRDPWGVGWGKIIIIIKETLANNSTRVRWFKREILLFLLLPDKSVLLT